MKKGGGGVVVEQEVGREEVKSKTRVAVEGGMRHEMRDDVRREKRDGV